MATSSNLAYKDDHDEARPTNVRTVSHASRVANDASRWNEAANESRFDPNDGYGVRNIVVTPTNPEGEYVLERVGPREREFRESENIAALAEQKKQEKVKRETRNTLEEQVLMEFVARDAANEQFLRVTEEKIMKRVASRRALDARHNATKIKGFASWAGLGAVWTAYTWQLVFALISIAGLGLGGIIDAYTSSSILGKIVSWFVDVDKLLPAKYIGIGFWGLTVILVTGVFIAYFLWYVFMGVYPFETVVSTLITILALSLSILPVLNLLPWLPLWVIYMNGRSAASMLHLFENG